ncbi:small secreted hydrophilic protein [Streptomyces sp. NPDC003691]
MLFSHRIAALIAVVAIPLGIAVTSYALTDSSDTPKVPPKVKLDSGTPSGSPGGPTGTAGSPGPTQGDETVAPPVSENPGDDDGPSVTTSPSRSAVTGRPGTNGGNTGGAATGGGSGGGATNPGQGNNGGDDDGPGGDDFGDDG